VKLAKMAQRSIYSRPIDAFHLNSCCVPGHKSLYISVNGDFSVCEKISQYAPKIGNVWKGIDFDLLYKIYFQDYKKISIGTCRKCWAVQACDSCYIDGFDENGLSEDHKKHNCRIKLAEAENNLLGFCNAIERAPELIDMWRSMALH
jgi:uncharacterized protein